MSTPTPSRQPPHVQHSFDGDVKILNATFDIRNELRKSLTALQQDLKRMENQPTQIKAEIKLRVGGSEAKQHSYEVTITSSDFDLDVFERRILRPSEKAHDATPSANQGPSGSPTAARAVNGQQATPAQSTPRPELRRGEGDNDGVGIRPFKRPRSDRDTSTPTIAQRRDTEPVLKESGSDSWRTAVNQSDDLFTYIKDWHAEWVRQGGWLFDNITKINTSVGSTRTAVDKKMDAVQDVLGQSMNSANASTMSELTNISKLIPWLEHCRKTSADKVQAREEKWRTSSATFHDQTRQEREAAEKRIEKKLEEQKQLLLKVARASGIDLDEIEATETGSPGASDRSLGAQLTAELNLEAERGNASRSGAEHETINIDDD